MWLARDRSGDEARTLWFVEPELDEHGLSFVPAEPSGGNQEFVVVCDSVVRRFLGRDLRRGEKCPIAAAPAARAAGKRTGPTARHQQRQKAVA
jgi:hypothetical protein